MGRWRRSLQRAPGHAARRQAQQHLAPGLVAEAAPGGISSSVRKQPTHQPLAACIWQMLMQGLATAAFALMARPQPSGP